MRIHGNTQEYDKTAGFTIYVSKTAMFHMRQYNTDVPSQCVCACRARSMYLSNCNVRCLQPVVYRVTMCFLQ